MMNLRRQAIIVLRTFVCVGALLAANVALTGAEEPRWPLLLSDDFEHGADHWQPNDAAAWTIVASSQGKVWALSNPSPGQPPKRARVNVALIKDMLVGDFTLEVRLRSTAKDNPHRDLCVVFGYQTPERYYYVHFGKRTEELSNQIYVVHDRPLRKISTRSTAGTPWDDQWHVARVTRDVARGTIEARFDDFETPAMIASDTTLAWGQVGLGSYDDSGEFDDVKLYGLKVKRPMENDRQ